MAERRLNWGLLSTARINRAVMPAIKAARRSRLLAAASRDEAKAAAYAREHDIPKAYGNYEALLADPEVDVIYNSLPNALHAEWTLKALRAGKHVLCEKPLGLSVAEVEMMTQAARQSGRILAEAFMYRHHPQTLKVKDLCDQGRVGKIELIRGSFTYTLRRAADIRLKRELGGGSIWDVGCYPIGYARLLAGEEPVEVHGWQKLGESGADVFFAGQLRFPDGILAQFDCGFRAPSRSFMEVIGTEGVLHVPTPFKPTRRETISLRREDLAEGIVIDGGELYSGEVEDMERAVLDDKPPRISLADSLGNVAAITALIESAESGRAVTLQERGDNGQASLADS